MLTLTCCKRCSGPIPQRQTPGGRAPKWCSDACRVAAYRESNADYRQRNNARKTPAVQPLSHLCQVCGTTFTATHNPKYCSDKCRYRATRRIRSERVRTGEREPYTFQQVVDRSGWACGLCGGPVDPSLSYPDPRSASVDHIIPLSLGGADRLGNTQLSHLGCNHSKGNKG